MKVCCDAPSDRERISVPLPCGWLQSEHENRITETNALHMHPLADRVHADKDKYS